MRKGLVFGALLLLASVGVKAQEAIYLDSTQPIDVRVEDALSRMTTHEKIRMIHAQSKFTSAGVPRLGIRQLNMDDGPHGVREELEWNTWNVARWTNDSVVAFPSLTCLAASWNRDLAARYGTAIGEEFAFRGKDLLLGPGANIARTPLNGRAFEYMGEDPCLAGEMAVPYIRHVQANGVGCCMKHFVLNDQETDRFTVNVNISERAMREIYLRPFEKAVKEAGVWSIMGSYNLWQGIHCSQNDALLNGILKREWGWDGALVSDWNAVTDTRQAATGGLDIEMGTEPRGWDGSLPDVYNHYYMAQPLEQMVEAGELPMSVVDEKVRRVLRLIFRTSMNRNKVIGSQCSEAHYQVCREVGEEGIVLLRNEKLLPLEPSMLEGKRVLVVGENATRSLTRGGGSSELKPHHETTPLEALRSQYGGKATITYCQGYASGRALYDKVDVVPAAEQQRLHDEALAAAHEADVVIYVGGMNKNHKQDCENGDREGYGLSFGQDELIAQLAAIQPHIAVCLFGGNAYATPWLEKVAALVHCWYLGSESGTALVNVLSGKVNPSGKLPVTFARRLEDYPSMQFGSDGYPGTDRQVWYREDLFVGYRWFDRHPKAVVFPFGYGLSYTTFKYGKPSLAATADGWEVSVDVTNTGTREGKETVQLYVGARKPQADRPVKELKHFAKVMLAPGETQTLRLPIVAQDLAVWDENAHAWTILPGTYTAYVAASAADVRGMVNFECQRAE